MNVLYVIYKYFDIKVGNIFVCLIIIFFGGKAVLVYIIV